MKISCIVATAHNNVIGKDNDIPWYLPADLKYFKKQTLGHHILMGRNCYESIGRPLPKRTNVIITRDPYFIASNCLIAHSINEALEIAYDNGEEDVMKKRLLAFVCLTMCLTAFTQIQAQPPGRGRGGPGARGRWVAGTEGGR